jgi:hypothetical protein
MATRRKCVSDVATLPELCIHLPCRPCLSPALGWPHCRSAQSYVSGVTTLPLDIATRHAHLTSHTQTRVCTPLLLTAHTYIQFTLLHTHAHAHAHTCTPNYSCLCASRWRSRRRDVFRKAAAITHAEPPGHILQRWCLRTHADC